MADKSNTKKQATPDSAPLKGTSLWKDAWRRLLKNKMAVFGGVLLILIAFIAIITPYIAPYGFEETHLRDGNRPPYMWEVANCNGENPEIARHCKRFLQCAEQEGGKPCNRYILGTDHLGRDLLTRIMWGGRVSLAVGFIATFVSILIGVTYGATAGLSSRRVDNIMMRMVDILYGLPFMFLVILLMVIFSDMPDRSTGLFAGIDTAQMKLYLLFVGLGCVQWLTMSRITRGQTLSLKNREFVLAAQLSGADMPRILIRHIIPNLLGPIIVYATLTVPSVMLEEAFLSFLGLGVQAPMASWGSLASDGREALNSQPWQIIFPGLALAITLICLNFLGDGLRDALDPQMKDQK